MWVPRLRAANPAPDDRWCLLQEQSCDLCPRQKDLLLEKLPFPGRVNLHLCDWSFWFTHGGCILFFYFLKIKRKREKKSEIPVAKSVNDTHNGVLTRVIIELDSTQLSAKTNLSAQQTWECLSQNGTGRGGWTAVFHSLETIKCHGCWHCWLPRGLWWEGLDPRSSMNLPQDPRQMTTTCFWILASPPVGWINDF